MNKLFGLSTGGRHGIAQLHVAPKDTGIGIPVSPLLTPLFRDLAEVLNKACHPLAEALKKYTALQSGMLVSISQELKFYTRAARLMTRLRDAGTGRLGDEAQRMHAIFTRITRHSLVLLNESFSSTSPAEALSLARDIVRLLREIGTRSVFATHLHELAAETEALNTGIRGESQVLSMVASLIEEEGAEDGTAVTRSYTIIPSPPMQSSCARELARQYGVSFDQLHQLLRERGVMRDA